MYTRSKQGPVNYSNKRGGQPQGNQNLNLKNNQSNPQANNTAPTSTPQQNSPTPKKQPEVISSPVQQPIKSEPATPTAPKIREETPMDVNEAKLTKGSEAIVKMDDGENESNDAPAEKPVPAWLRKKGPGFKINKRIKRRRQNARLRKILQPKNAIMVLNELKTGIKFTIQEQSSSLSPTVFVVNAEVDGKVFVGQGLSKPLAKQNAAENALKSLLLEKLVKASKNLGGPLNEGGEENAEGEALNNNATADSSNTTSPAAAPTPVPPPATGTTGAAVPTEGSQTGETPMETETVAAEDDMPWGSLASFALYRLFLDWQSQGTHVPFPRQSAAAITVPIEPHPGLCKELYKVNELPSQQTPASNKGPAAPMKKIPENPTERHPVMLLNQLRPGTLYVEQSRSGVAPNITFIMGCTVDGKDYIGTAKNKKDAKKECAKAALAGSMNIVYN